MKNKIFKIGIIIIDIIAITILVIITMKWINNHKEEEKETYLNEQRTINYKKFTFNIPNNIQYKEVDDYIFNLFNDDYNADIEIYLNDNNFTFENTTVLQKTLIEDGYKIGEYYNQDILDKNVLIFKNYNQQDNSYLCYFKIDYPFAVKIELSIRNNKLSIDDILSIIIKIFDDAKYTQNDQLYNYHRIVPNN